MAENVERTTISVARAIMKAGVARAKALGYKTFSAYVAYLIDHDTKTRPDHIHIRSEKPRSEDAPAPMLRVAEETPEERAFAAKRQAPREEPNE